MYVDPNRNTEAGNLKWILPYCKPDLPRVAGAIVLFCVNNTMALIIPLLSGSSWTVSSCKAKSTN